MRFVIEYDLYELTSFLPIEFINGYISSTKVKIIRIVYGDRLANAVEIVLSMMGFKKLNTLSLIVFYNKLLSYKTLRAL